MKRVLLAIASIEMLAIGLAPTARADTWNKRSVMTVNETVQVPNGAMLTPGTYVIKLADSKSDRHIVQIFNAEETELITTVLAIPNYRLTPTGESSFAFWEMPPGQPRALRAWFYPGDNFGQEFAYPKAKAVAIAAVDRTPVPMIKTEKPAEMATAPIAKVTEEGKEEQLIAQAPAVPPLPSIEIAQAPAAPAASAELPKTASPYPLIGLAGFVSLLVFGVLRTIRTS